MTGTKSGGQKAAKTNIKLQGKDFYRRIGKKGGTNNHHIRWFALHPELAQKAGKLGGKKSSRAGIKTGQGKKWVKLEKMVKEGGQDVENKEMGC